MDVNPFAVHSKPANLQPEVTVAASESEVVAGSGSTAGLKELHEAVQSYQRRASRSLAVSKKRRVWTRFIEFGRSLLRKLGGYVRKALDIALHKFVIELCAMVISAVFGALSSKGYGSVDISTKDVLYRPTTGTAAPTAASPTVTSDTRNPFESWSTRTASAW
jgi:hypothetical protein